MTKYLSIAILFIFSNFAIAQEKFEVFFDFNKEVPTEVSNENLSQWINNNRTAEVIGLSGFADSVDVSAYNKELSSKRIQSVLKILRDENIKVNSDVKLKPFGEDFDKSIDQAKNRKVAVYYKLQPANIESAGYEIPKDTVTENVAALFKNVRSGDLIRLPNIHFFHNREEILPRSEPLLEQLYEVLAANPKLSIEIHGHMCCNPNVNDTRLSYRRAKYIFSFLLKKGIPLNRLAYMGFGSADPIYPIPEKNYAEQLANRRVEILIVKN